MISSIELRNFKCFEKQEIKLGKITLLSGLNGLGKSTILQGLLLLRQSFQQGLLKNRALALNGELVQLGTAKDILFEEAIKEEIGFQIFLKNDVEARWLFKYNRESDVLNQISRNVKKEVYKTNLFRDNFHYLKAERIGPRNFFQMSDNIVRQHKQLGTRGEYTAHFLHLFGMMKIPCIALGHEKAKGMNLRAQVEAWLGEISPGTRIHVESYSGLDLVNLNYSFALGEQTSSQFRSTNVGFGITYTLPILVAILSSSVGTLVLLENPEAHLHPRGQVLIGELMAKAANCGVQIIVETHSDHVLNGIRIAVHSEKLCPDDVSLNFFDRKESQLGGRIEVISPKIDRDGRIDKWPDGFFDEWDKSLETLLVKGEKEYGY